MWRKLMKKKPSKKLSGSKKLFLNPDIVMREEGKEALIFDPSTGSIKVMNYVGKLVWKLVNGKNSMEEIEKHLIKKFKDTKPQIIRNDLDKFLKNLQKLGYLGTKI
jgi:hypothetical protein